MTPLKDLRRRFACAALLLSLTMLSGCIASEDALFNTSTTPMRAGRYDVQYLVDGRWTTYGAGSPGEQITPWRAERVTPSSAARRSSQSRTSSSHGSRALMIRDGA